MRFRNDANRVRVLVWIAAPLTLGACAAPRPDASPLDASPPNIVVIIADDLSWDDTSVYGHPHIQTPQLDRLARAGMRFTNAILTASSCSPSRASIVTGLYPHETDAEQLHWPLPADRVTFVERLRAVGYWTAAAGKWHLGDAVKDRFDLVREADPRGFSLPTGADAARAEMSASGDPSGAGDWIRTLRDRPRGRPFFLWLAALDPHRDYSSGTIPDPHRKSEVVVPPYFPDVAAVREDLGQYYDEITRLDTNIGRVLDELEEQGVAESTLVLFLSDNGRPFPRDKTTLYDGGIKTPWIIRWPRHVAAGSICRRLVSAIDIAPTLLELASAPPEHRFRGKSFLPLLRESGRSVRRYAFAEDHWHDYEDFGRAVRDERFKYIRNFYPDLPGTPGADAVRSPTYTALRALRAEGALTEPQRACFVAPRPEEELYDCVEDPYELNNLAGDPRYRAKLDELRTALAEWRDETSDRTPKFRTPDEFDRETGAPLPNRVRPRPSKREMAPPE